MMTLRVEKNCTQYSSDLTDVSMLTEEISHFTKWLYCDLIFYHTIEHILVEKCLKICCLTTQEKHSFTVSSKSIDMENSKGFTSAALLMSLMVFHWCRMS